MIRYPKHRTRHPLMTDGHLNDLCFYSSHHLLSVSSNFEVLIFSTPSFLLQAPLAVAACPAEGDCVGGHDCCGCGDYYCWRSRGFVGQLGLKLAEREVPVASHRGRRPQKIQRRQKPCCCWKLVNTWCCSS